MEIQGKSSEGRNFLFGLPERLEPQTEAAFHSQGERDLARRSVPGSMVYFVVTLAVAYGTPYGSEHPYIITVAAAITCILGATRLIFGMWLAKASGEALLRWRMPLRASILGLFVFWGLFSALTLELYQFSWTTMLVLFATSALAGGGTSSLAPRPFLGRVCLISIILPAILWSAWHGEREGYSLVALGTIYLAFLLEQIRQHWEVYRSTSVAAALEAKRENDKLFRTVFEAADAGMGLLTPDGCFFRVNSRLCALLDKAEEDLLASDLQTFFPSIDLPGGDGRKTVLQDSPLLDFEHEFEYSTGEKVWLSATLATVGGRTNERPYYVLLARDVSERKQADLERKKMEARLSQARKLESIGALAGGVAHDFNNLLTVIIGYAELAQAAAAGQPVQAELEEILKASRRAASLTRQLLAFGRAQVLQPERVRLNDLLGDMRELLGRTLGENIELRLELGPDIGEVLVDAGQMEQVFLNLALNARDAMPEGGTFTVRTSAESDSTVRLTFRDTGVGMDAETRRRAFEPFFTTKGVGEGVGLGLASVYGIIKQSGGAISLDSEPGEGTTVLLSLPLTTPLPLTPSDHEQALRREPSAVKPGASGTVLIVEDEDSLRELVRDVLGNAGYAVVTASDGRQALELAESHRNVIHLLLTDVIMPGMNGKEVASRLSEARPELPVLFMTGYSDRRTQLDKALTAGARLIHKPFTPDELLKAVRLTLQRKQAHSAAG